MTILLHKPFIIKVTTKGEGESKIPKILTTWFMNDPRAQKGCKLFLMSFLSFVIESFSVLL